MRYYEHSKCYVLINKQHVRTVTKLESCSANFIESKFPKKGEVDKNLTFYEMGSQEEGILSRLAWNKNEIPKTSRDSGSNSQPNGSTLLEYDSQQPWPHRRTMKHFL